MPGVPTMSGSRLNVCRWTVRAEGRRWTGSAMVSLVTTGCSAAEGAELHANGMLRKQS